METTPLDIRPTSSPDRATLATVEVVVPVHNEERVLAASIRSLHCFLADLPFTARIVIADNASTDATPRVARGLAVELPDADVVCYMDVDLSTDLNALEPLVAPLLAGHSDVAIGSRLMFGSHVRRQIKREVLSRGYNRLLRAALRARFSDAQRGFKAIRADALDVVDDVRDDEWFFDTELLVLAQRRGLRIHEVPVDWIEDLDSRVRIIPTALADLRGVARLAVAGALGRWIGPLSRPAARARVTAGGPGA